MPFPEVLRASQTREILPLIFREHHRPALEALGDVEQRRWHIQLWVADLADPYGQRIHTRRPEVGP